MENHIISYNAKNFNKQQDMGGTVNRLRSISNWILTVFKHVMNKLLGIAVTLSKNTYQHYASRLATSNTQLKVDVIFTKL